MQLIRKALTRLGASKSTVKGAVVRAAPLFERILRVARSSRTRGPTVVVLGARSYGRELVTRLRALKYRSVLIESAPQTMNWLYADVTYFLDAYDLAHINQIVDIARREGAQVALLQSGDGLIEPYFAVNRILRPDLPLGPLALKTSMSKVHMRNALQTAGLAATEQQTVRRYADLIGLRLDFPVVVKAEVGQGARGARLCGSECDVEAAVENILTFSEGAVIERYLTGRQFNVDGVFIDGTPHIYLITEECYDLHLPDIMPCWFLFNVGLPPSIASAVTECALSAISACGIRMGAFHCEVKSDGNRFYAIDLANRMGADFPKYVASTTGRDQVEDYVRSMLGLPVTPPPPAKPLSAMRIYNYLIGDSYEAVQKICASSRYLRSSSTQPGRGDIYEFEADDEAPLRELLIETSMDQASTPNTTVIREGVTA